jgi:hypothetical protein
VYNDPLNKTDPTGTNCTGAGDQSNCTIDTLNGKKFDRADTSKNNPKLEAKIERLEGNLKKAYVAAQKLGKDTITVAGDPAHGIADTKVSGDRIAGEMQESTFNAETRTSQQVQTTAGPALADADKNTHTVNFLKPAINAPQGAYGDRLQQDAGIHEAMHFVPYLSGWQHVGELEHETPFRDAIEQLLGPWPNR